MSEHPPDLIVEQASQTWPSWVYVVGRLLLLLTISYATIVALLAWFEEKLVFPGPRHPAGGVWEGHGLPVEDVYFTSEDGTKLHGWHLRHDHPRLHVLYCHGNAGTVAENPYLLRWLLEECEASVFIFDYRGYGRSEGTPSEAGILADARAARAWFARRNRISEEEIVLYGRSLGGAVALDLAADGGARGLVLESTFTSLPDVAAHHYWWVPVQWLMRNRLEGMRKMAAYSGPLLQYHSRDDEVVPYILGEQLFAASASEPKEFFADSGPGHNDSAPTAYHTRLREFLQGLAAENRTSDELQMSSD